MDNVHSMLLREKSRLQKTVCGISTSVKISVSIYRVKHI